MRCIYCLKDAEKRAFSREHVVPNAFGRFKHALVLKDCVCRDCNKAFGNSTDIALARESAEGLERYQWGIKNPTDIGQFKYGAVTLRASVEGDYSEAISELIPDEKTGKLVLRPVPQVAFQKKSSSGFIHYTEAQLLAGNWRQNEEIDWRLGTKVIAPRDDDVARLTAHLRQQGIEFKSPRNLLPPEHDGTMSATQEVRLTEEMRRGIAKISFNYLASQMGREFVLREEFNSVRDYVLKGTQPDIPPVRPMPDSILGKEQDEDERPVAHIVAVRESLEKDGIIGQVTLFGFLTYNVILVPYLADLPRRFGFGHIYNVKRMEVTRLEIVHLNS